MADIPPAEQKLRHDLQNVQQEKLALKSLLTRAANELDNLSDSDCGPEAKRDAEQTAQKLRRAAST